MNNQNYSFLNFSRSQEFSCISKLSLTPPLFLLFPPPPLLLLYPYPSTTPIHYTHLLPPQAPFLFSFLLLLPICSHSPPQPPAPHFIPSSTAISCLYPSPAHLQLCFYCLFLFSFLVNSNYFLLENSSLFALNRNKRYIHL